MMHASYSAMLLVQLKHNLAVKGVCPPVGDVSATHASPVSILVNDAAALAPFVFSGDSKLQTCKITKINGKGIPYPPKSTIACSMVVLVLPESSWISRFEANSLKNPKHGKSSSGRSRLRTMAKILSMMSHDHIRTVSFD